MDQSFLGDDTGNTRLPRRLLGFSGGENVTLRDSDGRCMPRLGLKSIRSLPAVSLRRDTRFSFERFYELGRVRNPAERFLNDQERCLVTTSWQT